ncbi:MAG TPA: DNA repair protein RadC [Candidatus Sulfotelmatobacter sp.]|jgi:DNA repair protein RadC|nr:DNA repair protein RadC [Candidatus Sulfotelmatobacter sp.]
MSDAGDQAEPHYKDHRKRLRQRFLSGGADALPDYELLELLLTLAIPQKDVKPLAKVLLARFGGFAGVLTASPEALQDVDGIKEVAATALKVVQAAAQRLARQEVIDRPILASWEKLLDYCHITMAHRDVEQFHLLFLDRKNVLIADEAQQKGTVDHTPVYPREVIKRALELNATAIIMVHNHPSGDPTPSRPDIEMTKLVRDAARAVGITLHDHLVIGKKGHVSFKSMGLL